VTNAERPSILTRRTTSRRRSFGDRVLFAAALLAFTCRALVPAGFMPNDQAGGAWLELCHNGLPPGFLVQGTQHDHAEHDGAEEGEDRSSHDPFQLCPLGNALSGACVATSICPAEIVTTSRPGFLASGKTFKSWVSAQDRIRAPPPALLS
jgi:hypothetical protein